MTCSIAAVVVTRNRRALLEECLTAIGRQTYAPDAVVVIDNASTDDTHDYLRGIGDPRITVVRLEENVGGAGGFSHGVRLAADMGVDLIWLMDDDCIPGPDALEELVKAKALLDGKGVDHSFLCSRVVDSLGVACNHPVPSAADNASGWPRWADLADDGLILVDECTFVSVAVSVDHVRRAGLPLRQMFIWGDDTEYTRRLALQAPGVFVGASQAVHKRLLQGNLSIRNEQAPARVAMYRHFYRNRIYVYRRYFPRLRYAAYLAQVLGDVSHLLVTGRVRRAGVVARGLLEGLFFRPEIEPVKPAARPKDAPFPALGRLEARSGAMPPR